MAQEFNFEPDESYKQAAVLIPLVQRETVKLLLTKRAEHLKNHAGQISFPGGRFDDSDSELEFTAIRETVEEIGVKHQDIEIIGFTSHHPTISDYWMSAFLGEISPNHLIEISQDEVAEAFEVDFSPFLKLENYQEHKAKYKGQLHTYYSITVENRYVWGATAKILLDFAKVFSKYN